MRVMSRRHPLTAPCASSRRFMVPAGPYVLSIMHECHNHYCAVDLPATGIELTLPRICKQGFDFL